MVEYKKILIGFAFMNGFGSSLYCSFGGFFFFSFYMFLIGVFEEVSFFS